MVDEVRRRLALEREQALARLASLTGDYDAVVAASLDTNADDEHDPEGTTIAFERSQIGALVRQVRHHVAEVDAALDRVDAGTYGVCEVCGRDIGAPRLEALPCRAHVHQRARRGGRRSRRLGLVRSGSPRGRPRTSRRGPPDPCQSAATSAPAVARGGAHIRRIAEPPIRAICRHPRRAASATHSVIRPIRSAAAGH